MPRKTKTATAADTALPSIPKELIDQFVSSAMSAEVVNAAFFDARGSFHEGYKSEVVFKQLVRSGCNLVESLGSLADSC